MPQVALGRFFVLQLDPVAFVQILAVVAAPAQNGAVPPPHVEPVKLLACLRTPLAFELVHQFLPRWEMASLETAKSEAGSLQFLDGPGDQEGHRLNPKGLEAPKIWHR